MMKLVDIIVYEKEKPVTRIEYFKDKAINFIRNPIVGLQFMYTCDDSKIYKTQPVTRYNRGGSYLIIETLDEAYIYVWEDEENAEN